MSYAGVEGTSSYGAGLTRHLKAAGIVVMEVERPRRRHLRRDGKSDGRDAQSAARAVLAGETAGEPKSGDGRVEMIRALKAARYSAGDAPPPFARGLATKQLVATAARFRLGDDPDDVCRRRRPSSRCVR